MHGRRIQRLIGIIFVLIINLWSHLFWQFVRLLLAGLEGTELAVRSSLAQCLGLARRRRHENHRLGDDRVSGERKTKRSLVWSQMVLESVQSVVVLLIVLALVRLRILLLGRCIGLLASRMQPLGPSVVVRSARALQLARRALAVVRASRPYELTGVLARHWASALQSLGQLKEALVALLANLIPCGASQSNLDLVLVFLVTICPTTYLFDNKVGDSFVTRWLQFWSVGLASWRWTACYASAHAQRSLQCAPGVHAPLLVPILIVR